MSELISKDSVDKIVDKAYQQHGLTKGSPDWGDLLKEIIKQSIYEAINSIDANSRT